MSLRENCDEMTITKKKCGCRSEEQENRILKMQGGLKKFSTKVETWRGQSVYLKMGNTAIRGDQN